MPAACGTGKTIIAAAAAKRIAPKGRVLVLVPTLALLTQTGRAWREAFEGAYGQQLAPMDLVCVDEGHRTSGSMGKTWADVHDQEIIPAARRLYMTATPRIWQERAPHWQVAGGVRDALPEKMAASMDDEEIFGPIL